MNFSRKRRKKNIYICEIERDKEKETKLKEGKKRSNRRQQQQIGTTKIAPAIGLTVAVGVVTYVSCWCRVMRSSYRHTIFYSLCICYFLSVIVVAVCIYIYIFFFSIFVLRRTQLMT